MKLSFSTLGCPKWDLKTMVSKAVEYGFDAIDFREYLGNCAFYEHPEFSTNVRDSAQQVADAGLEVSGFSSSAQVFCETRDAFDHAAREVAHCASLCGHFRSPFIRVFPGFIGDTPREQAIDILSENLADLLRIVKGHPVRLLVETHDDWVNSSHLASVMNRVDSASAGIVWDVHHPYRFAKESPAQTWTTLGKWICNTHWKDSLLKPNHPHGHQLCGIGDGDLPLGDFFACLKSNAYNGPLTLEWEKMWDPELDEPEVAFPQFVRHMRKWMDPRRS